MEKSVSMKIKEIIMDRLSVEEEKVVAGAELSKDLGADSLDIVEMVMSLEEAFSITIPEDEVAKLKTFGEVESYIIGKMRAE